MCYACSEISNFFWEENPANICCKNPFPNSSADIRRISSCMFENMQVDIRLFVY